MRTESELQKELDVIEAQIAYLDATWTTAEESSPDQCVYDDDFAGDWREMKNELEGMQFALQWALGGVSANPAYGDGLVPRDYAEDMCTGHGYPEKAEEAEAEEAEPQGENCHSCGGYMGLWVGQPSMNCPHCGLTHTMTTPEESE